MTDDDEPATVWQRVKPKIREYEGPKRREADQATIADLMKFLPLIAAVLAGVTGYVKLQAKVETLDRDLIKMESNNAKAHADIKASVTAQWTRIGDHLQGHN